MIVLDKQEQRALGVFLSLLPEETFWPPPQPMPEAVFRTPDGQVIVPVTVEATQPSLSLALLMAEKAEQVYKQTGCRFVLAQCLKGEPGREPYVWTGTAWHPLPSPA